MRDDSIDAPLAAHQSHVAAAAVGRAEPDRSLPVEDAAALLAAAEEISKLRDLEGVMAVVRQRARAMTRADGVSFILREGDQVFYADEDAIGPLWKGRRFPMSACISGWAILHRQSVAIADIYADTRIPVDAYRPTFVQSLLVVPIRSSDPIGAIGAYWADKHAATKRERLVLETLAGFAAVAVSNAQLYQEARDAVRARDEWIGIASHELRTPLTPIKLHLHSTFRILNRGGSPEDVRERVRRVDRSVDRLAHLVEQLLEYSHVSSGGLALVHEPFDLAALARDVCERFTRDAPGRAAPVRVVAPPALSGCWDRARTRELLTNLISNAVKCGSEGPVTVEVAPHERGAMVRVTDDGPGIAPEDHERIFQPFTRIAGSADGVGLGLWFVRKIVDAHGGGLELTSTPGKGTRIAVLLPSATPAPTS
jgi:signal transduction histidine kinase